MSGKMNEEYYADLKIGGKKSFTRQITKNDILVFSELTGDKNPLHLDEAYARQAGYEGPVVFGLLVNSFLSRLVGMYLPGKYALILYAESYFRKPCFENDILNVLGEIKEKVDSQKVIVLKTEIKNQNSEIIQDGKIFVKVLK